MLLPAPVVYRKRPAKPRTRPLPPAAFAMVSATYEHDASPTLTLAFNQAINIDALDGAQIVVNDGEFYLAKSMATGGGTLIDPQTVRLVLYPFFDSDQPDVLLTATNTNGIVSAADGSPWAGAVDVVLPYP